MQLCEALLAWLSHNVNLGEYPPVNAMNNYFGILKKVRMSLLPLGFATGKKRFFPNFADEIIQAILFVMHDLRSNLLLAIKEDASSKNLNIRLTEYSEDNVFNIEMELTLSIENIVCSLIKLDHDSHHHAKVISKDFSMLSFDAVLEVDISKCPKLHFAAIVAWLLAAFPSLRILKASYCLKFEYENLCYLLRKCPLIEEIDLTVEITPVIPSIVSVLSECTEEFRLSDRNNTSKDDSIFPNIEEFFLQKHVLANISSLILEGRNDMNDLELLKLSSLSPSLSNLNIKGCTLLSDLGISNLLVKCRNIQSLIVSYTAFGRNSILTLFSSNLICDGFGGTHSNSASMVLGLQQLQIDGCVDRNLLVQLLSQTSVIRILSLKETAVDDAALYKLTSKSLETIDVSDTLVSMEALHYVMKRNPNIRCLRATGCRNLHYYGRDVSICTRGVGIENFLDLLSKRCNLEELALGWGFISPPLEKLKPAFSKLKAISLGIGAVMDQDLLRLIPKTCPLLESVVLRFQVISDDIIRSILESLKNLQALCLYCCLGDSTSSSFCIKKQNLRILKLYWVTPWMTNNDLAILAQNCSSIVELSLSDSQEIISSGWPGLSSINLEECGKLTSKRGSGFFSCIAIEELLLRHNVLDSAVRLTLEEDNALRGCGLAPNFITEAASKVTDSAIQQIEYIFLQIGSQILLQLPLLRKLSLDLCDASEGGFNSPSLDEKFSLSTVKICRCKAQKCGFELEGLRASKPVHKETIVLEWTSKELRTTVIECHFGDYGKGYAKAVDDMYLREVLRT
ncbi:BTB/POZ domain-containing protein FBL11 [Apostasia shenzhenica]|uniref:BTB/POZ domain-containing protein FBL11 n=1 Tax=Apostasia shenzhenica TaxID=1088818 RepID=A0A2I0B3M3_9ASPA|nr:BTB/POZ domain-containing protein FBL11 [Apostasia shenzhenica]